MGVLEHMHPDPASAPSFLVSDPHFFSNSAQGLRNQLMGHSMGAAPVLSAAPLLQQKGYKVPGVIVLDVVEGEYLQ